jgi:hypothetical protein
MNINGRKQHNAKKFVIALDPESQDITLLPLPDTYSTRLSQYNDGTQAGLQGFDYSRDRQSTVGPTQPPVQWVSVLSFNTLKKGRA